MEKVLSIIIPTYNMEKYLRKCLDSLIVSDENMQRLEVLVINDGSKDSSSQIAHEYEAKYPQTFRVIDKENGNYGSCINRGLKEATGKYVKVLDADDYMVNTAFDDFISFLTKRNTDIVISDTQIVDETYKATRFKKFRLPQDSSFTIDSLGKEVIHMHSLTYKVQLLKDIDYHQTEGVSYTDNEWSTWPLLYFKTASYFHEFLYCYFVGREGQTVSHNSLVKNRFQFFHVANVVMSRLENMDKRNLAYLYLINRLRSILAVIYKEILYYDDGKHQQDLIGFDNNIKKEYPQFYHILDEELLGKYVKYRYIFHWRNGCPQKINRTCFYAQHVISYIHAKFK